MSLPATDPGRVSATVSDGVATITFAHPKGNSLPGQLLASLAEIVSSVGEDPAARVIVLRSEGTGPFCGGASFDELRAISDERGGRSFFMGFATLILAMIRCPKVIVTRVQGRAVGGGVGIVAASDYSIAHSACSIRLSELAVGIGPFVVGPAVERKVGPGAFAGLAIDADWRTADWAYEHNLYTVLRPNLDEVDAAVSALSAMLAASNPDALTRIKQMSWAGTEHWEKLLPERAATSGQLVLSEFTRQALAARR
jgi:methylglutaconyl-CoA hydratase